MKLLVAALDQAPDGFTWTVVGEPVRAETWCDVIINDPEHHNDDHDCLVSFLGLGSDRACTLAEVREVGLTFVQLREVVRDCWARLNVADVHEQDLVDEAEELIAEAEPWTVGTFLRRWHNQLERA